MSDRNWFITGASRGFGRSFAQAALAAGDRVAATVRDPSSLDDLVDRHRDALVPIELDVTDRDAVFMAVGEAHDRLGRLDVVVNNAGYGYPARSRSCRRRRPAPRSRSTCSARCG